VTKVAPLEVEINGYKETLEAAVTDLDGTDMFLGHDWLVKHNPEVNWKNGTIKFTRCLGNCTMMHKDIRFNSRRTKETETKNGEVTKVAPLEIKINGHKETLEAAVTDLDGTDMFLGHDWLVKYNLEVNWKNGTIKFTRCLGNCTMKHDSNPGEPRQQKQWITRNRTMGKLERNRTR